jgi:polyhydroxyalkanoate synthesis regulator phasin
MPPRFNVFHHIEPHAIRSMADTHPRLRHLADVLVEKHGLNRERARHFVERLVTVVLNDFGETYTGEMSARLDGIVKLREKVTSIYESTINGKGLPDGLTPSSVEGMFRELQNQMNDLHSPTRAAEEGRLPHHDDIVSQMASSSLPQSGSMGASTPEIIMAGVFGDQLATVQRLGADIRDPLTRVAKQHPDKVRKIIGAETQEGFSRYARTLRDELIQGGMNEEQIGRILNELERLNQAQRPKLSNLHLQLKDISPERWDDITTELKLEPPQSNRTRDISTSVRDGSEFGVDLAVQPHGRASEVRAELGVTGKESQSAHIGPTSFLRRVLGYSRSAADTVLLDPDTHRAFDSVWKDWAKNQRRAGKTHCTAGELFDVMGQAIDRIPGLPPRTRDAIAWRLHSEIFKDLGLTRDSKLELPYSNIKPTSP